MKVCIAEKPSVASEVAQIIGAKSRKDGYFEGNGYQVTWTFGHLCTLKEPNDYHKEWKRWNIAALPMIPQRFGIKLINNQGVHKQFKVIEKLLTKCEEVINCGDAGIEGELIQRWVISKARCSKPLRRLWISSLTEEAIREGFENLKQGSDYDRLYAAGNARAVGDWLLGMNATRLYTLKYANNKGVLSIGRVQTPTLALIVDRQKQIDSFVPETFWELKTNYRDVVFTSSKGRFDKQEDVESIIESLKNNDFEITSFARKKGKEAPPKLLDLTSLQVEANKKYGFSAEDTLKITQKLYEKKFLTYPRVDTTFLPNDMHPKIGGIMQKLSPYSQFTEKVLAHKIPKLKRVFDDKKVTDHHAIIPTGVDPKSLYGDEQKVYDLVARRFIANFLPDCIVSNTTVTGKIEKVNFKTTGKQIIEENWRELYPRKSNDSKDSKSQIIPEFTKGEKGPHKPFHQEKQTQAPKLYTEATLLRAMETAGKQVDDEELRELMKENGIGRPSTRANIIETLFKRKFITKQRKNLIPTPTGIQLIDTIKNDLLKSVELTGLWERKLRDIEYGKYEAQLFISEMKEMVNGIVKEVKAENAQQIYIPEEKKTENKKSTKKGTSKPEQVICPKCKKGTIVKGKTAYGCNNFKNGCDFRFPFTISEKKLTEKQIHTTILKGKSPQIKGFIVNGEKTEGIIELSDTFTPELKIKIQSKKQNNPITPQKLTCPVCGKGTILKGKAAYGCSEFKTGCSFVIPFTKLKEQFNTETISQEILNSLS